MTFRRDTLEWTYPRAVGLADQVEKRRVATVFHEDSPDAALEAFYAVAVPEIAPGPAWLREIAMVDYDYMSDAGAGWGRDIATLAAALPRGDRGRRSGPYRSNRSRRLRGTAAVEGTVRQRTIDYPTTG
jgi:hypothetical protein